MTQRPTYASRFRGGLTCARIMRLALPVVAVVLTAGCGGGDATPQLHLLDLTGRQVDALKASDAEAIVFLFTSPDCPISNRYAPEVRRIYEKFAPRGVAFWLVYPDPMDLPPAIRGHIQDYGYPFDALRDPRHTLVKRTQVLVTPEVAVFEPGGQMVYRGRIDDRFVEFGKTRPAPTTHDLEEALEATLEGKPVVKATAPAIGCFIADLQ